MKNKGILWIALITVLLLLIPLAGNYFVEGWDWSPFDFASAGVLIFGSGLLYELVARTGSTVAYRVAVGIAIAAVFLLIWINGAVGIIGNEDNPANLMYFGVILVALIGAALARLKPRAMAYAMFAAAFAQLLVPLIAFFIWPAKAEWSPGVLGVFLLNAVFVLFWIGSASLFRHASVVISPQLH